MTKSFTITGTCVPGRHYMADTTGKMNRIRTMIANGDYFTINKPRQYGKSTMLNLLERQLTEETDTLVLAVSFEEIDAPTYKKQELFIATFLDIVKEQLEHLHEKELAGTIPGDSSIVNFKQLDQFLTGLITRSGREAVLMIDEVDKACNNQLFLDFLGMLRSKYLKRNQGKGRTFLSVILAGVHDVKTLRTKIRPEEERMYNSPWNIAVDFDVDFNLTPVEITSMLEDYASERKIKIDISNFSEALFYFTSGYPFLVSYLCKIIDENLLPEKKKKEWIPEDLLQAIHLTLQKSNTNFETLTKNLENNPELYDFVFDIIMNKRDFSYNLYNPLIHFGTIHGILDKENGKVKVHNRFYEQIIFNYMASKLETAGNVKFDHVSISYINEQGTLNIERVIRKFQEFIKEQYSEKDKVFLERNGRLLFLSFLKPIINGKGFDFKEVQISEEKRLDIIVTYLDRKYIIELKIWRGEPYHQAGIEQLCDYLDCQNQTGGYLLIYDLRKESGRVGKCETIKSKGKTIFSAWV